MDIPILIGLSVAASIGSNIDDLFILIIFFANPKFPKSQVVLGQYMGMGALLSVSALASFVALFVPSSLLGLIGIIPIVIGIKEFFELWKKDTDADDKKSLVARKGSYLPSLTVALVTFSGAEEIGIYGSVFATNNQLGEIITIIFASLVMTGLWCVIAHYLANRTIQADRFQRLGGVMPFVLIGLGIYILAEAYVLSG